MERSDAVGQDLSGQAPMIDLLGCGWRLPGIPGSAGRVQAGVDAGGGATLGRTGTPEFAGRRRLFPNLSTGERQG